MMGCFRDLYFTSGRGILSDIKHIMHINEKNTEQLLSLTCDRIRTYAIKQKVSKLPTGHCFYPNRNKTKELTDKGCQIPTNVPEKLHFTKGGNVRPIRTLERSLNWKLHRLGQPLNGDQKPQYWSLPSSYNFP